MEIELINYTSALDRLGGDKEFLVELLEEMIMQLDLHYAKLVEAFQNSDFKEVHSTAHGLKGASSNLDLTRFVQLFEDLEMQSDNENVDDPDLYLTEIKKGKEELRSFIDSL